MPPLPQSQWARVAATRPGSIVLATGRPDAENRTSYLFTDPVEVLCAQSPDEIPGVFDGIERALRDGRYAAGFLSYEAGYHFEPAALRPAGAVPESGVPLAWFGVYERPFTADGFPCGFQTGGEGQEPELEVGISRGEYARAVDRIRQYIAQGDFYQANFTVPVRMKWSGNAEGLFERILANQPVPYGALVNLGAEQMVSASPELFFRRSGSSILVRPMKGTCARGRDCAEDARNAAWLAADEKNRAENVMIVDLLRNDLGRICTPGSIRTSELFRVERYPSLLQMTSTVRGELRNGVTQHDIFRALFPCGSITGAPKVRTMQAIRELEHEAREIGCGAIGLFAPNGDAAFSVAIRTAMVCDGEVRMRVGSGITFDSNAEAEFEECLLKAQFLVRKPEPFELIETLRWQGSYWLLGLHLDRLAASATYFDFAMDREEVVVRLQEHASGFMPGSCHRVRLLMTRSGDVSIASQPFTPDRRAARVMVARERIDAADPFLRHKTTRRGIYDRALAEARDAGFDDAIFLNRGGEVTECAIHNLLIVRGGEVLTPALDCGVLPGVYRRYLLERRPDVREAVLTMADLDEADRVYIFNSVRGLRRVRQIVGYSDHADTAG